MNRRSLLKWFATVPLASKTLKQRPDPRTVPHTIDDPNVDLVRHQPSIYFYGSKRSTFPLMDCACGGTQNKEDVHGTYCCTILDSFGKIVQVRR